MADADTCAGNVSEIACAPPAPPNQAAPCEALERRKDELEEEKKTVKDEIQDEEAQSPRGGARSSEEIH